MDRSQHKARKRRIRALIMEHFGGYQELGDEIGVSPQAISEVVNDRTTGAMQRYAVAAALGSTVAELWTPEGEEDTEEQVPASAPAAR